MTWAGCVSGAVLAGWLLAGSAPAQPVRQVSLTVIDHLSLGQQEETIAVYLAGVLVGTLHVDASHPDDSFEAHVPPMAALPFALCGRLLRREPGGDVSSHRIDNGGTLTGYEGGRWAAITLGDVAFTLQEDSGRGESTWSPAPACSAAVS